VGPDELTLYTDELHAVGTNVSAETVIALQNCDTYRIDGTFGLSDCRFSPSDR
jgi:hypothetical protein